MRGVIVYDSVYGNTKAVAESIAKSLESAGHKVDLVHVKDALRGIPRGDFVFLGSPTRVGTMTRTTKKLLKNLSDESIKDVPVVAFDTEGESVIRSNGASAAAKIHDLARAKGAKVHTPVLKVGVTGIKGPLSSNAEDVISAYVKEFLSTLAE